MIASVPPGADENSNPCGGAPTVTDSKLTNSTGSA